MDECLLLLSILTSYYSVVKYSRSLKAVLEEGNNPEDYHFEIFEKKAGKRTSTGSKYFFFFSHLMLEFNRMMVLFEKDKIMMSVI